MQPGDIVCLKVTGELVSIIDDDGDSKYAVRRPVVGRDGITHSPEYFFAFELETEEEHLKREAQVMFLKVKIQKELDKELRALDPIDKEDHDPLVN